MRNTVWEKHESDRLEAFVDRHGVENTLRMVAVICQEKASHLESNWQDFELADEWHNVGCQLEKVADRKRIRSISV